MRGKKRIVAMLPLLLCPTSLYAESLCLQCLNAASQELTKCLAAAISKEDKRSCQEKREVKATACEEGECRIERAAKSDNKDQNAPEKVPEKKE
jgi:hypothetical protein